MTKEGGGEGGKGDEEGKGGEWQAGVGERNACETKSFRHRCGTTAAHLTRPYCYQLSMDRVTLGV